MGFSLSPPHPTPNPNVITLPSEGANERPVERILNLVKLSKLSSTLTMTTIQSAQSGCDQKMKGPLWGGKGRHARAFYRSLNKVPPTTERNEVVFLFSHRLTTWPLHLGREEGTD